MKSIFSKISCFTMAFLVLFSTLSINVEKHFCGDFLVDISYFGNNNGCGDILEDDCDKPAVVKEKKCCSDEVQQIEGQDDLNTSSVEKITLKKQFALAFTLSYINLFRNLKQQIVLNKHYSPPKLIFDIQVLHEVFII